MPSKFFKFLILFYAFINISLSHIGFGFMTSGSVIVVNELMLTGSLHILKFGCHDSVSIHFGSCFLSCGCFSGAFSLTWYFPLYFQVIDKVQEETKSRSGILSLTKAFACFEFPF